MATSSERPQKIGVRVDQSGFIAIVGIWMWFFTIGYLHLSFWAGLLAIILWPYDLGAHFWRQ